ncbi:MAG: hypothetical protein AB8G15_04190 [Saprospiraceae bacterium]
MKLLKYTFFFVLLTVLSCTKPPDYPIEPVLEFNRLSKNSLEQGNQNDFVDIIFDFTDGDGDIGHEENTLDVTLTDTRDGTEFIQFRIPEVPEQGVGNGISGEISVRIFGTGTCCIFPDGRTCESDINIPTDEVIFLLRITDRAGNESNQIEIAPITLLCN